MTCECVAHTEVGRLRHRAGEQLGRHRHDVAFAAVVLAGTYLEAGDRGRMRVRPGDVILHDAYESHLDQVDRVGAEVLVLPWRTAISLPLGRVRDPDAVARLAERDVRAAATLLESEIVLRPAEAIDWPDQLAADLRRDPDVALDQWAISAGLRPESVSRGFRRAYGITPVAFRARSRTLHALAQVTSGRPLAQVAIECGFADQAHFTRSFRLLTGTSPSRWARLPLGDIARPSD
jgi:AraC-like DNA-binding protein